MMMTNKRSAEKTVRDIRRATRRIVSLIKQGLLRPLLAGTFPLRELAGAQRAFMEKRHVGNIVVEAPG